MSNKTKWIHTSVHIFYDITKESFEQMNSLIESGRRPKPNGEPGWIITYDPDGRSFKAALVVITFSGIYLEALLHLLIVKKKGLKTYKEYDRRPYEVKLKLLGCSDELILEECEHYRKVRREIIHEKAHIDTEIIRFAQDEATKAFKLIGLVNNYFKVEMN